MAIIVDSYSESNYEDWFMLLNSNQYIKVGQTFTGNGGIINSISLYLRYQVYQPTGNAYIEIYAHTGTFGIDGKPTGSVLATSENFDVSSLDNDTFQLKSFVFTGTNKISLTNGIHYCFVLVYPNGIGGTNNVQMAGDNSLPSHSGNIFYYHNSEPTTCYTSDSEDMCFYVYADNSISNSNITGLSTTTGISTLTF